MDEERGSASVADLGLAIKRLQVRHHRSGDAALQSLGLTFVQWDALRHLHEHPGASLHDLAVLTFQTDQSFGALAARMIDRRLIERVPGPGRAVRHRLTGRGEAVRAEAQERVERMLDDSFGPLDQREVATLRALLTKLVPPGTGPAAADGAPADRDDST